MCLRFTILLLALLLPLTILAQSKTGAKYIGYEYAGVLPDSTLPNGVKSFGGGMIGDINADPVYEIAQMKKGTESMLWFNVSTGQDSTGVTGWKVLDVLSFPALRKSDYLFFYGDPAIGCKRGGKDIPNLVGVGTIIRRQGTFKPSRLWAANLTTKKFEPVRIAGVKCRYSEP